MNLKRWLMTLAFAGAVVTSFGQSLDLSKPVVKVNDTEISFGTYYRKMERLVDVGRLVQNKFVPAAPGFLTLQQLINEALMVQLAKEQGVAPTQAEIDKEFANATKDDPELMQLLAKEGFAEDEIKRQILVQMSEFRVQTKGINISDQQVEEFYQGNKATYTTPKRWQLFVIAVSTTAEQDEVDAALKRGEKFPDVATKHSKDVSASVGGFIGVKTEVQLTEKVRNQVTILEKGETTSWIDGQSGKVKFYVADVLPQAVATLTPELRRAIRERLMVDRGRIKNDVPALMAAMRKKAKIETYGTPFDSDIKTTFNGGL